MARRLEKEYLAYDTTSVSSYSKSLKVVQYGYNKEHDPLPQLNLALVFGERSRLPVYYRSLPGNIPEVKTLQKAMSDQDHFKHHTLQEALDELDIIECIEQPGKRKRISEMTQKQCDLYEVFGVTPPNSLV